ncbi:MAG: T9SS type A sorting domain-containing protein, partial [Polaribacter sp.]|nr:T9SS type A sorting domain-containing protein [Polaribacter sp.]
LYPNPASNNLTVITEQEIKTIEIYNIQGQKVKTSNQKQINVSDLAKGIYLVKIQNNENSILTKKFIKV